MPSRSGEPKGSFLARWIEKLIIGIPYRFALRLLKAIESRDRLTGIITLGALLLASASLVVFFKSIFQVLAWVFESSEWSPGWRNIVKTLVFYCVYVLMVQPCFLVIAFFTEKQREALLGESKGKGEPSSSEMRRERLRSDATQTYLGRSYQSGKSVFLTNEQRLTHMEVVGSTGTGKTESVLLPMLAHDIASGKGAVIIDGKGDLELLDRIHAIAKAKHRIKDLLFFSLAHPGRSNTYNPLLRGNATELKDKIVGSMAWNEEFYRRMAEQATFTILSALKQRKGSVKFSDLHSCLTEFKELKSLKDVTQDPRIRMDLERMLERFKDNTKFLSGLIADLYLTSRGEFQSLVNVDQSEIDLLEAYQTNKIVYFQLNLQGYGDTAKRMGRMILQDIKTVSSYIQSHITESKRHFYPVFVDDASSFLELNFIDFLNKARSAKFAITLLHQSLGDLVIHRDFSFQQQVIENTNIKLILRQDDPQSVEKFTKIAGTRKTLIPTWQTEEKVLGKGFTGTGSLREGQTFRVEPDLIRGLKRGEAVVIWKMPGLFTDHVKLDFFGHCDYPGIFKPIHKPDPVIIRPATEEPKAALQPDEKIIVKPPSGPLAERQKRKEPQDILLKVQNIQKEIISKKFK